jgi:DNA-binding LytR/AlgR family response regulator
MEREMTDPTRPPVSARRAALGFANGAPVLSLRLPEEQLNALKEALQENRDGWFEVEATDGAVLVDLDEVAYLRVESGEHRVGF